MSKELIERLREAVAQRVASTAMIGADDLIAAADALESLEAAYASAVEAGKALAKQAFKAEQERDALAAGQKQMGEDLIVIQRIHSEQKARLYGEIAMLKADIKAAREQKPVAQIDDDENFQGPCRHAMAFVPMHRGAPLYAHPVPARELTDETIQRHWDEACKDTTQTPGWSRHIRFARAIERYLKGEGK